MRVTYTPAQQTAFIQFLKQRTAVQLLVILVFTMMQDDPKRQDTIQRIINA